MQSSVLALAARFRSEQSGNVAITFGLMSIVMMFSVGAAVDFGRSFHAESKLQIAADAAATAAAAALSATPAEKAEIARKFFQNNNAGSFASTPDVSVNVDGPTVQVKALARVPAAFTKIMGVETLPIEVEAEAQAGATGRKIEVAMMIDVTGSMGATRNGQTKIQGLKTAADDLLDIFFPGGASDSSQVRVGIVPMADYVNVGRSLVSQVTGLPDRGAYANLTNLKSTRNGPFSGNYSGSYGTTAAAQPTGSQHGATPSNGTVMPGQVSGAVAGGTYTSSYCENPNSPVVAVAPLIWGNTGKALGVPFNSQNGTAMSGTGARPAQLLAAGSTGYYKANTHDNSGRDQGWEYYTGTAPSNGVVSQSGAEPSLTTGSTSYYIPMANNPAQVTYMKKPGTTVHIGLPAFVSSASSAILPQIKSASATAGGYFRITGWSNGAFTLAASATTTGYFLPVPESMSMGGGTLPQCTSGNDQNNGYLVSCVTERTGTNRYTDEPYTSGLIGPYNQVAPGRSTNKVNYSEDGKCWTAGRELPAIIPLTSQRAPLADFFAIPDSDLIGGATPGHLGHAWAWYMLSPKWSNVWPSESDPAPYTDETTKKFAIIMTDGEYNTQYSDANSAAQALELCNGMKAQGIAVFTIGFGFSSSGSDTASATMLRNCASDNTSYFFPYDGAALRSVFQEIGARIQGGASRLVVTR